MTKRGKEVSKRKRLRVIEALILDGRKAKEIHEILQEGKTPVSYGTVRNDISEVYKAHKAEIDEATELKGRQDYLARCQLLRRKAFAGFRETDQQGNTRIRDRNLGIVAEMDRRIAQLSGVSLKGDERSIHLNITAARNEMDRVMLAVFSVVTDSDTQDLIIQAIEALAEENLQIASQ
jgi:hypothetical protein